MIAFPDLSAHGYQVIKELGHNLEGGRFTYLAKRLADNVNVAIKQFQFATGSGWNGFRAIEREIQSLQGLNHRGIPKYLDKFETDNGYCLVTEYFPADTLAAARSFTPDQIKQVAVQLLEILVYLQERMPPVIHRDIKPENILVDENLNVYLIDFGFARVGSGSIAMSSANAGTFGFMAPEQIRNLNLTNASDLYGLGLTLICLIGAIRSTDIGKYIDYNNQLDRSKIDPKLKGCSFTFMKWLDQMVAPDPSKRFADAKTALESLKPLYVVRVPEVKFDKSSLEFTSKKLGESLSQTITISNSIPETILEGHWEVAPHRRDPSQNHDDHHAWISFKPTKIRGNQTTCEITVNTKKLSSSSQFIRQLIFVSDNAIPSKNIISLTVSTSKLVEYKFRLNTVSLVTKLTISSLICWLVTQGGSYLTNCINIASATLSSSSYLFAFGFIGGPITVPMFGLFSVYFIGTKGLLHQETMGIIGAFVLNVLGASCSWGAKFFFLPIIKNQIEKYSKNLSKNINQVSKNKNQKNVIDFLVVLTGVLLSLSYGLRYIDPMKIGSYLPTSLFEILFYIVIAISLFIVIYPYANYYQKANDIRHREKTGGLIQGDK
ncbi:MULTISPECIES: serine/threonine protein kinase [Pseudanabaena]|uniref:non-specific serine/threonine protein kinase n=2 Tax=Pseudanabaena TaxID=1152 RepID=L8N1B8_9CYAN|nr:MULTISPECIES: serine/threonine-protein kinase [Pseudanabaena]ELS33511.1 serine/threonine protein kinase [Pseudanabaena biceps PCC 7429]MDG3494268.1 serine/threonine-protein kinase [Pseudanabaena catenata USMAC16]